MVKLKFCCSESKIDISQALANDLLSGIDSHYFFDWLGRVVHLLDDLPNGIVFRIGKLQLPIAESRKIAHQIVFLISEYLKEFRGLPKEAKVESDKPQNTIVPKGHQVRTLLPHHDSGHASYLTPSLVDCPSWNINLREFSDRDLATNTSTWSHKLYQGIFVVDPGDELSITPYFDWIEILKFSYEVHFSRPPQSIPELARWLGKNITNAYKKKRTAKVKYLTVWTMLGSPALMHLVVPIHRLEADFDDIYIRQFPELEKFRKHPYSIDGKSPTERYLDDCLNKVLGMNWDQFRDRFEICVSSERFDLVLGHNLTSLHGGMLSGIRRILEPICIVIGQPVGREYETWLANCWRVRNNSVNRREKHA